MNSNQKKGWMKVNCLIRLFVYINIYEKHFVWYNGIIGNRLRPSSRLSDRIVSAEMHKYIWRQAATSYHWIVFNGTLMINTYQYSVCLHCHFFLFNIFCCPFRVQVPIHTCLTKWKHFIDDHLITCSTWNMHSIWTKRRRSSSKMTIY